MNIFYGITYKASKESLAEIFLAILKVATSRHLVNRKWSLAELCPDEEDFNFLYRWMGNVDNFLLAQLLEHKTFLPISKYTIPSRTGLGLALLFLDSEIARRYADEGHLWSHCYAHFPGDARKTFFLADGQPTHDHKELIELIARRLKLRHVFAIEGSQHWFDTVFLQFGFTYKGFMRRLPEWLSGHNLPQAVGKLLNSEERSDEFWLLWEGLKSCKRNNSDEKLLRQIIIKNPWVLNKWERDLIEVVCRKTEKIEIEPVTETENFELAFLTSPKIRWNPPNEPVFEVELINLKYLNLSAFSYDLLIEEKKYSKLLKQEDESYAIYPNNTIFIPIKKPSMIASLVDKTGNVEHTMLLTFWEVSSDINIYKLPSGHLVKKMGQEKMNTQSAYILGLTPDLEVEPEVEDTILINNLIKFYLLKPSWSSITKVMIEGEYLWSPEISNSANSTKNNKYLPNIGVRIKGSNQIKISTPFSVEVTHCDNETVVFARANMQMLKVFPDESGKTTIGPTIIKPESASSVPIFYIGMRRGNESKVVIKELDNIELIGVTQLTKQGWELIVEKPELIIRETYTDKIEKVKFYLPKKIDEESIKLTDYALMEGDVWVDSLWAGATPIRGLAGLGAPLTIKVGPYNSLKGDILQIAYSVINRGIITEVTKIRNGQENDVTEVLLKINLIYPIETDKNYQVVIWDTNGLLHSITSISSEDISWIVFLPCNAELFAIGIAYKGVCIGSWWAESYIHLIDKITSKEPTTAAAIIRWLQLPILNKKYKYAIKPFINLFPDAIFGAWFGDLYLPENLCWGEKKESWFDAMRKTFRKWNPNKTQAIKIMKVLSKGNGDLTLEEIFEKSLWPLQQVDPILMAKILRIWIKECFLLKMDKTKAKQLINQQIAILAQLPMCNYSESQVREKYKTLLQDAAKDMKKEIDTSFLEKGLVERAIRLFCGKEIENFDKSNLALAISIKPFRDLLSIKLLEQIIIQDLN